MRFVFEPYNLQESVEIAKVHASRLGIPIDVRAAEEIAKRGRGVPRIIVGYLERARDLAVISKLDSISVEVTGIMFRELGIDETGLTKTDLKILKTLHDVGTPIGLDNLSVIINEAPKTILSTIEPFLIQQGLMIRSGRGRIITNRGIQHLENSDYLAKDRRREEIDIGYVRR
jgi:Holliday junction DNA helicase RuvB